MTTDTTAYSPRYRRAVGHLVEVGTVLAERDEHIYEAHRAGVPKAEIARITGLSWATVDRAVRDMQAKNSTEEG
jgi:hypothetical protein